MTNIFPLCYLINCSPLCSDLLWFLFYASIYYILLAHLLCAFITLCFSTHPSIMWDVCPTIPTYSYVKYFCHVQVQSPEHVYSIPYPLTLDSPHEVSLKAVTLLLKLLSVTRCYWSNYYVRLLFGCHDAIEDLHTIEDWSCAKVYRCAVRPNDQKQICSLSKITLFALSSLQLLYLLDVSFHLKIFYSFSKVYKKDTNYKNDKFQ